MSIKFFYQDDIRRVSGTPPNYKALLQTVKQLFSDSLPSKFSLQYEDCEGDKVVLASDEDYETMVATELSDSSKCLKIHLIGATEDSISIIAKEIISSESEKEEEEEFEPRFSQEMRNEVPSEVQERDVRNDDGEEETKSVTVLIETEVVNSDSDAKKKKDISSQVDLIKEIELSSSLVKKSEEVSREVQTLDVIQVDRMRTIAKDALMEDLPKIARLVKELLQNDEDKKRKTSSKFAVAMKSLKKKAEEKPEASQVVHSGVTCDKCGICPIGGIRYKCSATENYDLCEKCEEKGTHPYPMLKIRNLAQAPYKVITELPPSSLMDIKAEDKCEISESKKKETLKTPKSKSKGKVKDKKVEVKEKDSKLPGKRGKSKSKRVEVKPKEMKPAFPYTFEKVAEVNQIPNVVTENSYMVYKTVTLKNSGECAWPSKAYIKCIDNADGEPTSVTEIESGKQINVILAMKSPGKIGKYSSKWQLCYTADEGQEVLLGSPFDLEFEVRDSKFEEEIKLQVEDKPKKEFTAEVLKQAKALKDIFHEKDLETICEYVANSPQKTLEEMIEEYLSFA